MEGNKFLLFSMFKKKIKNDALKFPLIFHIYEEILYPKFKRPPLSLQSSRSQPFHLSLSFPEDIFHMDSSPPLKRPKSLSGEINVIPYP